MVSTFVTMAGHAVEISAINYTVVNGNETSAIVQSNMVAINGFINILDVVALVPEETRPTDPDPLDVWCLGLIIRVMSFFNIVVNCIVANSAVGKVVYIQ